MRYVLAMKYIDAHCHYFDSRHPGIVNAVDESDWSAIIDELHRGYCLGGAIGIHPWAVGDARAGWDMRLTDMLYRNPGIMLGEIGLDAAHGDFDLQMDVFLRQMEIATELHRAVHIHCVRAWGDMLRILRDFSGRAPVVIHGFGAGVQILHTLMRYDNVFISYGARVSDKIRECIAATDVSKILVESDSFDANAAGAGIADTISMISEIKSVATGRMVDIIYDNTVGVLKNEQAG